MIVEIAAFRRLLSSCVEPSVLKYSCPDNESTRKTRPYPTSPTIIPKKIGKTIATSSVGSISLYFGRE